MPEETTSVNSLLEAVGDQRSPDEPLYVTASRVYRGGVATLSDEQMAALEVVGFESVRANGAPSLISVRSVVRMIEQGRPYDQDRISPKDRANLMLLGFLALAGEMFMHESGDT